MIDINKYALVVGIAASLLAGSAQAQSGAITQVNTKVLGDAPAIAMGNLFQATSQALSNAAHNATNAQQQSYVTSQAATTMGVATLYSLDTASTGIATKSILGADPATVRQQTGIAKFND